MAKTKITIPTRAEINNESYLQSDFATAMGAACNSSWAEKDGIRGKTGSVWLREAAFSIGEALCTDREGAFRGAPAYSRLVALPRFVRARRLFQHPQPWNITATEHVLMINGKVALYPQTHADKKSAQEMMRKLESGRLEWIDRAYTTSDADDTEGLDYDSGKNLPYREQKNKWCMHNGKIYALVEKVKNSMVYTINQSSGKLFDYTGHRYGRFRDDTFCQVGKPYFFECQPIRAELESDGNIQCQEGLFTTYFELQEKYEARNLKNRQKLDTDKFAIGQRLNEFWRELERNIGIVEIVNSVLAEKKAKEDGEGVKRLARLVKTKYEKHTGQLER